MLSRNGPAGSSRPCRRAVWIILMVLVVALGLARPGGAAVFTCAAGDVACLIAAIDTANANGEVNLIRLEPGAYTLTAENNFTDGPNGLPSITSPLTIGGNGSGNTVIERAATAPQFRVFHVAQSGRLNLEDITVRGGLRGGMVEFGGGGILNRGTLVITHCAVTDNFSSTVSSTGGGGIASLGRLFIAGSTVANNTAVQSQGGGIFSPAAVTVINSTIRGNRSEAGGGGIAISNTAGSATIIGTTIVDNHTGESHGGGLHSESSAVAIVNSTFAENGAESGVGGGLFVRGGVVVNTTIANNRSNGGRDLAATSALALHNTIVSGPSDFSATACQGQVTSLDNNLFFDPNCAVALLPHDRTGDTAWATTSTLESRGVGSSCSRATVRRSMRATTPRVCRPINGEARGVEAATSEPSKVRTPETRADSRRAVIVDPWPPARRRPRP